MQDNTNMYQDSRDDLDKFVSVLSGKKKLTDWKNEPTLDDLMHDINGSRSNHSAQMSKISKWLKELNPKKDTQRIKKGRSGYVAKTIRKLAEWRYSSLASAILNERNLFQVQATTPEDTDASFQNTLILNYQFNNLINKVYFINSLVRTMVNEGTAIVRVGWEVETQIKEREEPIYEYMQADERTAQLLMQMFQQIQQEVEQSGEEDIEKTEVFKKAPADLQESIRATQQYGTLVIAVDTGEKQIIKEEVDTKNRPSVKVIDNADLLIDPTCEGDFSKAKFVVYKYITDLSTLKTINQKQPDTYSLLDSLKDGANGLDLGNVANLPNEIFSNLTDISDLKNVDFKFKDEARKQITAFEYWGYWDIDGTGIAQAFVATIAENKIIRLDRNPFPDGGLPFVVIPYLPVKNSVYGEPDAELVTDNQEVIQALTRSMIDINARSANGQVAMPKGFLDPINLNKFIKGEDYVYNPIAHPAEAIYMHTANEVPASVINLQQMQYAEAESITGVKSFANGIDGNAYGQVVSGMKQAVSAINQREGDIIFRISKGLEEVGNKILSMNMEWLSEEEVIPLTQDKFISIKRRDIKGDFHLSVKLKSNSESEGKAQQLAFMAQTLGADADWGIRQLMLIEIGQLYGLDSFVSAIKKYQPQPNPLEEERAKLENELLKQKLAKEQAETEYYQARASFIANQADNIQSQTDLNALDFMEQQEGVKHARQREIVRAQAEAQNEGKLATELLKLNGTLQKAHLDSATKRAIAQAQGRNKDDSRASKTHSKGNMTEKARQAQENLRKSVRVPNPEADIVPDGLHIADGLGSYITGDNQQ